MVLFYVTTSSSSTQAISERDGVPIKEPMSGGGNLSSPSATAQSFGGQQRSTLGGGGGARPMVIVGRGGARGALMSARDAARNDYVFFPEPVEPLDPSKLGETDVSPEDGGAFPPSSPFSPCCPSPGFSEPMLTHYVSPPPLPFTARPQNRRIRDPPRRAREGHPTSG